MSEPEEIGESRRAARSHAPGLPAQMRAVVLTGHGGLDRLEYFPDWPTPNAAPDDVVVAVGACGVNNTDLNTRVGWYARAVVEGMTEELAIGGVAQGLMESGSWSGATISFPRIQGSAIVGTVVGVGARVSEERIGERVLVDPVLRDPSAPKWARLVGFIGSDLDGGYADYAAVPAANAFALQTTLSDVELASFAVSHTTAEEMLERAELAPGETLLVTGASGGVGTALIQLAKLRGAQVIAITRASKEERVSAIGADVCVARDGDVAAAVERAVGERRVDVVCDVVGGPDVVRRVGLLRRGGRYVVAGAIAGPLTSIDLRDVTGKNLLLIGVSSPEEATTTRLISHIENGMIGPLVEATFPLERLVDAQRALAGRRHVGKLVIDLAR